MKKIIVIGASAASMAFMNKLRSFDKQSTIACFSAEQAMPYNRCLLADFLTDDLSLEQLFLKPEQFFTDSDIALYLNHKAVNFDFEQKRVLIRTDASEFWVEYDYLFLGMGARPYIPQFLQTVSTPGIFTFHTLSDMQKIEQFLQERKAGSAVVIGAGLNGIEAASSLAFRGLSVTLVEAADQILPGQLDPSAAQWVVAKAMQYKIQVITGQKVTGLQVVDDCLQAVMLSDETEIQSDMLIITAGSVPNSDLFKDSSLYLSNGLVLTDRSLKTNIDTVFAAGDLCKVYDFRTGQLVRSTTWSDAMLQGLCAATALSSTPRLYVGAIGLRDSYFFGKDFYACGQTVGCDQSVESYTVMDDQKLQKIYVQDKKLIGFVLIGDLSRLSAFKQWYMTQKLIDLSMFS